MNPGKKDTLIFISYYHQKDEDIAKIIKEALGELIFSDKNSPKVFRGEESLFPGSIWIEEIRQELCHAKVVVAICSPESVKRPWVAFECGMGRADKNKIIAYCHSGIKKSDLPEYLKEADYVDASEQNALDKLVEKCKTKIYKQNVTSFQEKLDKERINRIKPKEEREKEQEYLPCTLSWDEGYSVISLSFNEDHQIVCAKKSRCIGGEEKERLTTLKNMHDLLGGKVNKATTGVAIGIQNCIYDLNKKEVYVGIRYKSPIDAKATGTSLAKGSFNTGYKLIRNYEEHIEHARRVDAIQDLFVTSKVKFPVEPQNEVYKLINNRLKLFGSQLFKIKLHPLENRKRESAYASILINNSCWYPRFEIGIWKFILLKDYKKTCKEKKLHFIIGMGEDLFQDYRGNVEDPWDQINFWIWVKDGRIRYRSYPEERFLPRFKPQRRQRNDGHGILISSEHLKEHYGIVDDLTPMVPDERLRDENDQKRIIQTPFSQPAARLLTWF